MCFKNWNFPSTAMEADIIVDGFKRSLDMHNLIYSRLIGNIKIYIIIYYMFSKNTFLDTIIKNVLY